MNENKVKVWLARDKSGGLWLYPSIPLRDEDGGILFCNGSITQLDSSYFPSVKWKDDEPTEAYITLTEPQEQSQPKQEIDWEQRRYEIAKEILIKSHFEKKNTLLYDSEIHSAISYADRIIDKLKEKSE